MARSEDAVEQQDDPNPWISRTGDWRAAPDGAGSADDDGGGSWVPIAAWAWVLRWCGAVATAKPARATPMTRPMASTAATGAIGSRRVAGLRRRAGRAPGDRAESGPASAVVTPYQARALTTPARPARGTA